MKNSALSSTLLGLVLIGAGQDIAETGIFTKTDNFPAFRWAGSFMALVGAVWLTYGLYSLLGGKRGKGSAKQTTGQDVASEKAPGNELDQSQNNGNDDTTDSQGF